MQRAVGNYTKINAIAGFEPGFAFKHYFTPQKKPLKSAAFFKNSGVPKGIRTPVTAVKGRCPRPLDDGDAEKLN